MKETLINDVSPIKFLGKKQRNSQSILQPQEKNKSIFEFFDYNKPQRQVKGTPIKKKKIIKEIDACHPFMPKYALIRNPSIPRSDDDYDNNNNNNKPSIPKQIDINSIQIFNEEMIDDLIPSFAPINDSFNTSLNCIGRELPISYNKDDYIKFSKNNNNMQSILIKFFLQLSEHSICIPKKYLNTKIVNPSKIALITGINSVKHYSLQYNSINSIEANNESSHFLPTIKAYIKMFQYNKMNNKPQKALVLFIANDHIAFVNLIELIFKDFGYLIIRTDEYETQKINRLNRISEATKSHRITSLPETVNDKLKMIEALASTTVNDKWKRVVAKANKDQLDGSILKTPSLIPNALSNGNNSNESREKYAYTVLESNVFQTFFNKKTLIFLIDSFPNGDEDKAYLNNIANKIPQSKCPIIILTNNLLPFKFITMNNAFEFAQIQTDSQSLRKYYLFLLSFAAFLHLSFDNNAIKGNRDPEEAVNQIKKKLNGDSFIIELKQSNAFNRIIRLVIFLLCECLTNLDKCQIVLFSALKQTKAILSINDKLNKLEKIIFKKGNEDEAEAEDINQRRDDIISIADSTEEASLNNKEIGDISHVIEKRFKRLTGLNEYNDPIVNCENHLIEPLFGLKSFSDDDDERNKESILSNEVLKKRKSEDKRYLNYHLTLPHVFSSNNSHKDYIDLLKFIGSLEVSELYQLLSIRLPRAAQQKKISSLERSSQEGKMRENALNKFMRNFSLEQFKQFIKAHSQTEVCFSLLERYFINKEIVSYFKDSQYLKELSKIYVCILYDA